MCGIAGFININPAFSKESMVDIAMKMTDAIRHRGPDDSGVWISPKNHLAMAFRRLSIIDLSQNGHQPLVSPDNNHALIFNGEIYNYIELHRELYDEGLQFEGKCDSVVLFHALRFWGVEKTLQKINGMFAFCYWNGVEDNLYLIRDRLGQKPLYYYYDNNTLVFASELKSLFKHPYFKKNLNHNAVGQFLKYSHIPEPNSIFENTYKVRPGEYLCFSINNHSLKKNNYWHLDKIVMAPSYQYTQDEAEKLIHEKLKKAVSLRMRSDVPFGAFLSGGIDSSLITALMQAQSDDKINTFSIGFHESEYDESPYAKKIAEHLGCNHTEFFVSSRDALNVIPELPFIYDEPFADSSQIPTFLLSKLTKQHVTVALSGDGGDETFAGYNRHFWVPNIWNHLVKKPMLLKKALHWMIAAIPAHYWTKSSAPFMKTLPLKYRQKHIGDKLYKILPFLQLDSELKVYDYLCSFWPNPEVILDDNIQLEKRVLEEKKDVVTSMMYFDTKYYLPGDILTKVDRASMAVSLEVRSPFLDFELIEAAWKIPLSLKLQKGSGKLILKNLLNKYIPSQLFDRPKKGFDVPIASWLRGPLKEWAFDLLNENKIKESGLFKPTVVKKYLEEHISGKRNWHHQLWCLLMFESWRQHYNL